MAPEVLAQVLRPLKKLFPCASYPDLLVGLDIGDDAAVYRINDETAVIQTIDFITPIVDDPYDYGAIAAANSLSDIFAMGGQVVLGLNIVGFPPELPEDIISEILRGGAEKIHEAGGVLAGGHSVDDKEPKYGLSVMGLVHPDKIFTVAKANVGDVLILTKPLGVGMITTAFKGDVVDPKHLPPAVESMKKLNKRASELFREVSINTCTDITGFSFLGHASDIAENSNVRLQFNFDEIPFHEGAKDYAQDWLFPAGSCRNQKCYQNQITFVNGVSDEMKMLMFTPETSGGLLAAVPEAKLDIITSLFYQSDESFWIVGKVVSGQGVEVVANNSIKEQ
jgi:selenide,water dikinase